MKRLFVACRSELVGELIINDDQFYQFQYSHTWLESSETFALSCALLLQAEAFSQRFS